MKTYFNDLEIEKFDYDRICIVRPIMKNKHGTFACIEIELRKDMDIKLVAEKFRRLATQIENMFLGNSN